MTGDLRVPEIYARQLAFLDSCPRRFAHWCGTEPGRRQKFPEVSYRLSNAVSAACAVAHTLVDEASDRQERLDLGTVFDLRPPLALGPEEALLFPRLIESYVEAVEGRAGRFRPGDGFYKRPSSTGRFVLAVKADMVFDLPDGAVEVRRLLLHQPWADDAGPGDGPREWDLVAALVLGARPYLRCLDVPLNPAGVPVERLVDSGKATEFGGVLRERVLRGLEIPIEEAEARPGSYCGSCEFLYGCPGIFHSSPTAVLGQARSPGG